MSIDDKVKETIVKAFNLPSAPLIDNADIFRDLRADSLEAIELVLLLEQEFNIEIPDDDIIEKEHVSVQQIIDYVKKRVDHG